MRGEIRLDGNFEQRLFERKIEGKLTTRDEEFMENQVQFAGSSIDKDG